MGKYLQIKDADFSNVCVEKVNKAGKHFLNCVVHDGYYIHTDGTIRENQNTQYLEYDVSSLRGKTIYVTISGTQTEELCYSGFYQGSTFIMGIGKNGSHDRSNKWIEERDCPVEGIVPNNADTFCITNKILTQSTLDVTVTVYYYE